MKPAGPVLLRLPEVNFIDAQAGQEGWTVVDMKKDWKVIFPPLAD